MRAFIAIDLPKEVKNDLSELQDKLSSSGADVKWVEPQNIHLTLKFLGEINEGQQEKVAGIIEQVAAGRRCFPLRLASVGAFPKMNFPRVIWAGIDKGDSETKEIAQDLEERLDAVGIPKEERPFSCHITLGRVRSLLHKDKLVEALKTIVSWEGKEFAATKMTLFKSSLSPKGPVYAPLKEANLKAP